MTRRSGRGARTWAARRSEAVPTTAPAGSSSMLRAAAGDQDVARVGARQQRGDARARRAARSACPSSSGRRGRSRRSSSASSISLVNSPLPPISASGRSCTRSPVVRMTSMRRHPARPAPDRPRPAPARTISRLRERQRRASRADRETGRAGHAPPERLWSRLDPRVIVSPMSLPANSGRRRPRHRDELRRDRGRARAPTTAACWPLPSSVAARRARALWRRRAGDRRPRPRAASRPADRARRSPRPGSASPTSPAVAATAGPGLVGGVMVGLVDGKGHSRGPRPAAVAVNHLEATRSPPGSTDGIAFPYLLLLVSGGHCQLVAVEGVGPASAPRARRSTTRSARRSTRSPRCWASAIRAAPR